MTFYVRNTLKKKNIDLFNFDIINQFVLTKKLYDGVNKRPADVPMPLTIWSKLSPLTKGSGFDIHW